MAYLELTAGQVDADSPIDATLMGQIKDNDIYHKAEKVERDGTIAFTGDQSLGGYELLAVGDIVLNTGDRVSSLFEEAQMIGDVITSGFLTSATSGSGGMILTDSTKNFSTIGVAVGDLVNIPSFSKNFMFIVSAVGTTTIDVVNSVDKAGATIYGVDYSLSAGVAYTVHSALDNNDWDEFNSTTLTSGPVTVATSVEDIHGRFIMVNLTDITAAGSYYAFIDEFGDIDALDIRVIDDASVDTEAIFYLRNNLSSAGDNIVLDVSIALTTCNVYVNTSIEPWQYTRLATQA